MKKKELEPVLTPEIIKRFEEVGDQTKQVDPIVIIKLIDGRRCAEMYLTDYEPITNTAFGYMRIQIGDKVIHNWNIFHMKDVESLRQLDGYIIEADPTHVERPISECVKELRFKIKMEKLKQKREAQEKNKDQDKEQEL